MLAGLSRRRNTLAMIRCCRVCFKAIYNEPIYVVYKHYCSENCYKLSKGINMDDIDLASKLIEKTIQKAIDDNKTLIQESGVSNCIDCDIDLGARKAVMCSAIRCIDCQELEDMKNV